ncbi:hypothetical protein ACFX19_002879 [Malus domestica]
MGDVLGEAFFITEGFAFAPVALSVGVDGHDLCVAGMGDVLDDISAFLSSRIRCMAINCASFSACFLEFSPRSFSSLFSLLWS